MGYGASAQRVDAKATGRVANVDMYKLGIVCDGKRGIVITGNILKQIYSWGIFEKLVGGFKSSRYGAYVMDSFFKTLESNVRVEVKAVNYVAPDAAQASYDVLDGANAQTTLKAGCLGDNDKSLFGNDIGIKLTQTQELDFKLTADIVITGAAATLASVEGLKVGHYVRIEDGTEDDIKEILTLDVLTKIITFTALTNAAAETVANTTVSRVDYKLEIAIKDINGNYDLKETHERIPFMDDSADLIERLRTKSYYLIAEDAVSASVDSAACYVDIAVWTALTSGLDGTGPVIGDYNTMAGYFDDEEITILLSPELQTSAHHLNMIDHSNDGYQHMYYADPASGSDQASLQSLGEVLRKTINFAMVPCDKWFYMDDPLNSSVQKQIPPSGISAAHYFNSYSLNGVGRVAAGNRYPVNTSLAIVENGLIHDDKAGMGDLLIREYSINIAKWKSGVGVTINSARTLSSDAGYKFQNQIVGFLLLKRAIKQYLEIIEQDESGSDAQEDHYRVVWTYLYDKYQSGIFYIGQKEDGSYTEMSDVVTIVNDFSINTLANIANGIEEVYVEVIFVPPIEEPILSLASAPVTSI